LCIKTYIVSVNMIFMSEDNNERRPTLGRLILTSVVFALSIVPLVYLSICGDSHNRQTNIQLRREIDKRYIFTLQDFVTGCPLAPKQQRIINFETGEAVPYNSYNFDKIVERVQEETGLEFKQDVVSSLFGNRKEEFSYYGPGNGWPDRRWSVQHRDLFEKK